MINFKLDHVVHPTGKIHFAFSLKPQHLLMIYDDPVHFFSCCKADHLIEVINHETYIVFLQRLTNAHLVVR